MLHEWLYGLLAGICRDREYVFASFVRHFTAFTADIFQAGRFSGCGVYVLNGIKSDLDATLTWRLERRLDWTGLNVVVVEYVIADRRTGRMHEAGACSFELSTGAII
jgi:hypothetical protein